MASKRSRSKKKNPSGSRQERLPAAVDVLSSPRAKTLAWIGFSAVLLLCCAWVAAHAYLVDTVTVRYCEMADKDIPAEKRMPVYLSEIAFDGYVWNRHAEHLGERGEWRVRHTDFDDVPSGREVHWNSAFAWYLRGLGEAYRAVTGDSLRNSIFRMSIWANPILLLLTLVIFTPLAARRFGPLCGAITAIGMVASPTFYEGFLPAYPDHHGLIAFALFGMVFGIAWAGAGWVQNKDGTDFASPHSLKQARHGMIFSGVCAAAGLWISAFPSVVVAIGIGMGAIASVAIFYGTMSKAKCCHFYPELWRFWGIVTAIGSLCFYLLEYFPSDLGMRLEINHPLYALAWLGGGWAIYEITGWLCLPVRNLKTFPWGNVGLCVLACSILPAFILIGKDRYYMLLAPFQMFMSANIVETLSLMKRMQIGSMTWQAAFGWFPLFLLAAGVLLCLRQVGAGTKAVLVFLSAPILLITGLLIYQVRWGMLTGPLYIALAGIVVPQIWRLVPRKFWNRAFAGVLMLGISYLFVEPAFKNAFFVVWMQFQNKDTISTSPGQTMAMLHRQMALAIRDSAAGKPVVLLSSPNSSTILAALGGFRTVGTLYWENGQGLESAAKALNAQSNEEALERIKKLGVTHVALMTWENFIEPFFRALYPKPVPGKSVENSFGKRALGDKQIPPWTRPLIFPPNAFTKALDQQVLLLQILPDQSMEEAKFHLARFVRSVEGNPVQAEMTFKEILEESPGSNMVRIELSNLYMEQHRYDEAVDQMQKALASVTPDIRANFAGELAGALAKAGQWDQLRKFLRWVAEFPDAPPDTLQNVAWLLSTRPEDAARDPQFALACCDRLEKLPHDEILFLFTKAAAVAASGDFQKALALLDKASQTGTSNQAFIDKAQAMRSAFQSGKMWTESR